MALTMSPPWYVFYQEVNAFFKYDPQVHVLYDDDARELKLFVDDGQKAVALTELLPSYRTFGNVEVKIVVYPANGASMDNCFDTDDTATLINVALAGNAAFCFSKTVDLLYQRPITYVVFRNEVVQYYTDDLGDYFGMASTLYEDIARDLLSEVDGIYFCTNTEKPIVLNSSDITWP